MHGRFGAWRRHVVLCSSLKGTRRAHTEAGASAPAGASNGQAAGGRLVNVHELLLVFKVLVGSAAICAGVYGLMRASYWPLEKRLDEVKAELKGDFADLKADVRGIKADLRDPWDRIDCRLEGMRLELGQLQRELSSKLDLMLAIVTQASSDKEQACCDKEPE